MELDRREFLELVGSRGAVWAAGAAALSAARSAAAAEPATQPVEGSVPQRVVVGVMGMGGRGTELARQFCLQPGVEVAYVCCADRTRMAAAAEKVEQPRSDRNTCHIIPEGPKKVLFYGSDGPP